MIEVSFVIVVVVLVVAAVLVLIVQSRKGLKERPKVEVSKRARSIPIALFCILLLVQAGSAAADGQQVVAGVGVVGAIGAAIHIAHIYRGGQAS